MTICLMCGERGEYYKSSPGMKMHGVCVTCIRATYHAEKENVKHYLKKEPNLAILCWDCKTEKKIANFSPSNIASHKTGFSARCKDCTNADARKKYRAKVEKKNFERLLKELL